MYMIIHYRVIQKYTNKITGWGPNILTYAKHNSLLFVTFKKAISFAGTVKFREHLVKSRSDVWWADCLHQHHRYTGIQCSYHL